MKRTAWLLLVLAGVGGGCLNLPPGQGDPRPRQPLRQEPPPPPVVTPDQVNETNARQKARSFEAELEYDQRQLEQPATPAPDADGATAGGKAKSRP
jgi:hypothetical protein